MTEYSMNIGIKETPRPMIDRGFTSMQMDATITSGETERKSVGSARGGDFNPPAPLANEVNPSNDSQEISIGPSAMDITMRTRNG